MVGIVVGVVSVVMFHVHETAGLLTFFIGCGLGGLYSWKTEPKQPYAGWMEWSMAVFTVAVLVALALAILVYLCLIFSG
ncbi:MAG: hypothetical protein H8E10_08145 [Desulfobacterales bacterium]|nr:hypothetical protein [Desulfobacterales bacterium]